MAYNLCAILRIFIAFTTVSHGIPKYFRRSGEISTPIGDRDETKILLGILLGGITGAALKNVPK